MDTTSSYLITLSSSDSKEIYPEKSFEDFTCELKDGLTLEGMLEVALTETFYGSALMNDQLNIFCGIIGYNVAEGKYSPLIRRIFKRGEYSHPYYIPGKVRELKRIRIYITNKSGDKPSVENEAFRCTLRLRKKGK
jgi:hypothetical protein